jgi:hypothetical protein
MLSEGADYPWLRWLCLRRNVDSRVRFIQEVGRALRSYPGKIEAVLLDPNDLFGSFRISYEEALGEQSFEEIAEDGDPQEMAERIRTLPEAKSLTLTELIIRRIAVAAEAAGMLPDRKVLPKAFRNDKPTGLQAAAILAFWNKGKRFVPANWMTVCEECVSRRKKIRRGFASDFSYVLAAICDCERFPPISTRGAVLQEGTAPEGEVEFDVPNDGTLPFKSWITGLNYGPE